MRAWLALLVLLLGLAGAVPACAHGAPMAASCQGSSGGPHRQDCDHAACIGCATPLPDPARPDAPAPLAKKSVAVAAAVHPLAGIHPDAQLPPPRLPA